MLSFIVAASVMLAAPDPGNREPRPGVPAARSHHHAPNEANLKFEALHAQQAKRKHRTPQPPPHHH